MRAVLLTMVAILGVLTPAPAGPTAPMRASAHALPVADRGEASFHADVPPTEWRALAIKSLPAGTTVRVTVQASEPLDVAFVHRSELERFPQTTTPLFRGRVQDRLQFSVIVFTADHYALVLDNRTGTQSVAVDLKVEAARAGATPKPGTQAEPAI